MNRIIRSLRNKLWRQSPPIAFLRDRRGVAAVEFAFVAVPFFGLLCAIFETGYIYVQHAQLQNATQLAARSLMTSSASSGLTYQTFLNTYLCPHLTSMITCGNLQMSLTTPTSWGAALTQENTGIYSTNYSSSTAINLPASGKIVVLQVVYPQPAIINVIAGGVLHGQSITQITAGQTSANGHMSNLLVGTAAFMVEPQ